MLREVLAQCSIRNELAGKFHVDFPHRLTLDQQMRIAKPLRQLPQEDREHVMRQLQGIAGVGRGLAEMVRVSLSNPLSALAGKSPFDRYMTGCRDSGVHWGIVRALQHLRDVITVKEETYFTDPTRRTISWRLNVTGITPAMLKRVEECLRQVDAPALHDPTCNLWLMGIQAFFDRVKAGTFRLPPRPATAPLPSTSAPCRRARKGEARFCRPARRLCLPRGPTTRRMNSLRLREGLRALRKHLSPQYLDLAADDFAALCRFDQDARDFARGLGARSRAASPYIA